LRAQRIADRIFEEISTLLIMEVADPRLSNVNVTDVRVDRELAFANIYVSSIEGSESAPEILDGLQHASGFLRSELSQRIQLRHFPRLRFYWDPNPEKADHIDKLLASLPEDDDTSQSQNETDLNEQGFTEVSS
jgi:ribosome-binding factor A